ncbi:MAG: flagellar export protein FliJ [Armatimonadota bacterium]
MKKFRFNLQRVLDYRKTSESRLMSELAVVRNEYEMQTAKLAGFIGLRDLCRDKLKRQLVEGDPEKIKETHNYLNELSWKVNSQEIEVERAAERERDKLAEVVLAAKDRRMIELLRDQKRLEHKHEVERQEQNFLDEIACMQSTRASLSQDFAPGG